jgi:hypothetical protein
MRKPTPEMRLERVLETLSGEIAAASDDEVLEACADLRIQPHMKGSMAFVGVKGLYWPYRPWVFDPSVELSPRDADDGPDLFPRQ